jgi:hypothetical protein
VYLKGLATLVHGQQVSHQSARHLQGRAVGVAERQLMGMNCCQLRIPSRRQLRGLDQYCLKPAIALLGERAALLFASRGSEGRS